MKRNHQTIAQTWQSLEAEKPTERALILASLDTFIRSRPGFETGNYNTLADYRHDVARASRQRADALILLRAVEWRASLSGAELVAAFSAYSGRLSWTLANDGRSGTLDYCPGQYYCTEYRAAVCAVLSLALWNYWREVCATRNGGYTGAHDFILTCARAELPKGVYRRWFRES